MMKRGSEFKSLLWTFILVAAIAYGGSALGWSPRPSEPELLFGMLFFIFIALIEIGNVLERIAPPKREGHEDFPP